MNQAQIKIEKSIELFKKMSNASWQDSEITGEVTLNQDIYELIKFMDNESLIYSNVVVNSKTITLMDFNFDQYVGQNVKIKLQPPRNSIGGIYFARNLDDLLSIKKFKITEPKIYYLADKDYFNLKNEPDETTSNYLDIIKLISIVEKISDHFDNNGDQAKSIILSKGKLSIPISYKHNDIGSLDKIEELNIELKTSPQIESKVEIFRSTLYESLINISENERFHHIIKCFDSIFLRYKDNFNLFMSEFSFDKIKEEISERKIEYIHKLNKVVSDIQNKILAIPVALLLVSTQMSRSEQDYLKNFVILLGSYVFIWLMYFLINNQLNTLETVKDSILHSKELLLEKYASMYIKFEDVFEGLLKRYQRQKNILIIIWSFALFSFIVCLLLFIVFTKSIIIK